MPKTKTQRIVFGILMSFFMAYGMEVYNIAIRMGYNLTVGQGFSSITYPVFLEALKEAVGMSVIVFIVSNLVGNRAGAAFMAKYCAPDKDNPYFCRVMRQAGSHIGHVSPYEPYRVHSFSDHSGRPAAIPTAGHLDWDGHEKLPDGLLLEHVRRRAPHPLDI